MTLKQKIFIKKYIQNGGNGTQAAMDTYNAKNYNSAHSIASENLQKPTIKREIEEALESTGLTDTYISDLLKKATVSGLGQKATNADSLRGIEMLLRVKGSFPDKIQKTAHLRIDYKQRINEMSYKETAEELKRIQEKTKKLLEDIK